MNKNTLGGEALDSGDPVDPLAPVTHGLEFIADHQRPWPAANEVVTAEARDALGGVADQVIILGLPEHVEVDSGLQAPDPYPPLRSDMPLPTLNGVIELVRSIHQRPPES